MLKKKILLKLILLISASCCAESDAGEPKSWDLVPSTPNQIYINTFKYGHFIDFKDKDRINLLPHDNQCNEHPLRKSIAAYSVSFLFDKNYTQERPMSRVRDLVTNIKYPSCNGVELEPDNYIDLENYNLYIKYDKLPENLWFKFEMNITRHRSNETIYRWFLDMRSFGEDYSEYFLEAYPSYGASYVLIYKKGCQDITKEEYEKLRPVFSDISVIYESPKTGKFYRPNQKITGQGTHDILVTRNDLKESHVFWERYNTDLLLTCYIPN